MEIHLTDDERQLQITNPKDIYPILQKIYIRENKIGREKEHFWIIGLRANGILQYVELIASGDGNSVKLKPVEVFRLAIHKGSSTIIAAHNHPSGLLKFSREDFEITEWLIHAGKYLGINVADHLIITETEYRSIRTMGIHTELAANTQSLDPYIKMELSIKDAEKKVEEKFLGQLRSAIRKMYEKSIPVEEIAEIYGMEIFDVELVLGINSKDVYSDK